MSVKSTCLISFVLVLALVGSASALVVKSGEVVTYDNRTRIPDGNTIVEAGGTLIFNARLDFDGGDELHVYGTVISEDTCKFPDSSGDQGVKVFIYNGGVWDAADIENRGGGDEASGGGRGGLITLSRGSTLIVRTQYGSGHQFYDPSFWMDDGSLITGEDGGEITFEELEGGAIKITNGRPHAVPYARSPNPVDGALHDETWVNLSWRPGDLAVSHNVYLGDNFDDVNSGAESTFRGNQADTFIVAGFPGFPYPDGLVPGTTYYWRIDEVNDTEPNSPWKSDIWSFSIPPKTAYFPEPADGAEGVSVDPKLSWTPGFGSKLHTVYFGETFDEVDNATGGFPQGTVTYSPDTLKMAGTYYWRVDEFDVVETYKGDIWSFTTEGAVTATDPVNGAVDVTQTPVLTWEPGLGAAHDIFFGTDAAALEKKGSGNLGSESYEPGQLQWNTTYYWRVDEADSANADSPWTGPLWSFTTANFLVIDDMEAYNDLDPAEEGSNRIFNSWIDGFEDPTNGALVGYDQSPFAEQTIVHSGNQSMPMSYDNSSAGKSEATYVLTSNRDWTTNGVDTLTIWYRGTSFNDAEPVYVALNDSAVVTNDNPDASKRGFWTQWNIDLQVFANQGVDLANVNSITLGLGNRTNPTAGGSGMMYFDDIRLYAPAQ
jgi:hypothetical protein